MDNSEDLATFLRRYREDTGMSPQQMAEKLAVSEYDYRRMENGTLIPSPEDDGKYRNALSLAKLDPLPPTKWYRSRKWHWVIPILISGLFIMFLADSEGYRAGRTTNPNAGPPLKTFFIIGAVICGVYWFFWRPEWPFRKKKMS